jgi:NADPH:quinone reductase-like Zn-dependent oxidoreductase
MHIALDYDGTYTADPKLWSAFVALAKVQGHRVSIVTMRYDGGAEVLAPSICDQVDDVIYTGRKAKAEYVKAQGEHVDVWIDDKPRFILEDAWVGD